jgi:hypothetical protein
VIANVSAHRRANAFAQALEDQSDRGTAAQEAEGPAPDPAAAEQTEQGRMTALAECLGELPRPTLDPEVKVVQRAQLVAAFEAMLQEGTVGGEGDKASLLGLVLGGWGRCRSFGLLGRRAPIGLLLQGLGEGVRPPVRRYVRDHWRHLLSS